MRKMDLLLANEETKAVEPTSISGPQKAAAFWLTGKEGGGGVTWGKEG